MSISVSPHRFIGIPTLRDTPPRIGKYTIQYDLQPGPGGGTSAAECGSSATRLAECAQAAGLIHRGLIGAITGVRAIQSIVGYGAWATTTIPAAQLTLMTTAERAQLWAAAIGLAARQSDVLVTSDEPGPSLALDIILGGRTTVATPWALDAFWHELRAISGGRVTGFGPRRVKGRDGVRVIDAARCWPNGESAAAWTRRAAAAVGIEVDVKLRRLSLRSVANNWFREPTGDSYAAILKTHGRPDLIEAALALTPRIAEFTGHAYRPVAHNRSEHPKPAA
jgi:hypothetical protein